MKTILFSIFFLIGMMGFSQEQKTILNVKSGDTIYMNNTWYDNYMEDGNHVFFKKGFYTVSNAVIANDGETFLITITDEKGNVYNNLVTFYMGIDNRSEFYVK